jgi:hypothetical protein
LDTPSASTRLNAPQKENTISNLSPNKNAAITGNGYLGLHNDRKLQEKTGQSHTSQKPKNQRDRDAQERLDASSRKENTMRHAEISRSKSKPKKNLTGGLMNSKLLNPD